MLLSAAAEATEPIYIFTTLAGSAGNAGAADGTGANARFNDPWHLAVDAAGNVYVADAANHAIRKITPEGAVTTFAGAVGQPGSADGRGTVARFSSPRGIAVGTAGTIYVADSGNNAIRAITPAGDVTTFAGTAGASAGFLDGTAAAARFQSPYALAVDAGGNVFVADTLNHTIRKITQAGVVSTFAGTAGSAGSSDGVGAAARFDQPVGVNFDAAGFLYVTDSNATHVRRISSDGTVTTLPDVFGACTDVLFDSAGNMFAASSADVIWKVVDGMHYAMGGIGAPGSADGIETLVRFSDPTGLVMDRAGTIYVSDRTSQTIRKGVRLAITWPPPAPIAYGTPLPASLQNATVNAAGTLSYSFTPGQVLAVGTHTLSATFVPTDGASRMRLVAEVTLQVGPPVSISWPTPAAITQGTALSATQLNAVANVPGSFTYEPAAGTVLPVGQHRLTATFTPADPSLYSGSTAETYLVVTPALTPVIPVLTQPSGVTTAAGTNATFTFAVNHSTVSYSWYESRNGGATWSMLFDDAQHSGTRTGTLTVNASVDLDGYQYRGYASAVGAWQWSEPAVLRVTGSVAYLGAYFGTFTHGGTWSLFVGTPSRFIGYLPGAKAALVETVAVNPDGTFNVSCTPKVSGTGTPAGVTLSGRISAPSQAQRVVTGTVVETAEGLTGAFPTTGALTNFSGDFFTASALGTVEGQLYVTIGYSGELQAVVVTPDLVDGTHGVLTSSGTIDLTTAQGHQLSLVVDPNTRKVKGTLTRAQKVTGGGRRALDTAPAVVRFAGLGQSVPSTTRFADIATRAYCGVDNAVTIGGFVVSGSSAKQFLIRAVGPSLAAQGIGTSELLADPTIEVYDASHGNVVIETNDNWTERTNADDFIATAARVGATALVPTDRTSAGLLVSLQPGIYTFMVKGRARSTGIVLLEVYDCGLEDPGSRFVNIATRAYSSSGNAVAIGGFVVHGNAPKRILLRAVGPTLATVGLGANEVLTDPSIQLFDASHGNLVIATNDDWTTNDNQAAIIAAAARVGASPINAADVKSSALLITLEPGIYSFMASGRNDTSGIVLVEAYDAD